MLYIEGRLSQRCFEDWVKGGLYTSKITLDAPEGCLDKQCLHTARQKSCRKSKKAMDGPLKSEHGRKFWKWRRERRRKKDEAIKCVVLKTIFSNFADQEPCKTIRFYSWRILVLPNFVILKINKGKMLWRHNSKTSWNSAISSWDTVWVYNI